MKVTRKPVSAVVEKRQNRNQEWWDKDCGKARKDKYTGLRGCFRKSNNGTDLKYFLQAKRKFEAAICEKMSGWREKTRSELISVRHSPQQFWKKVKLPNRNVGTYCVNKY